MQKELLIQRLKDINPPKSLLIYKLAELILLLQMHEKARKEAGKKRWANDPTHSTYKEIKKNWKILRKKGHFEKRGNKAKFIREILDIYENKNLELSAEYLKKQMLDWEIEYRFRDIASSLTD